MFLLAALGRSWLWHVLNPIWQHKLSKFEWEILAIRGHCGTPSLIFHKNLRGCLIQIALLLQILPARRGRGRHVDSSEAYRLLPQRHLGHAHRESAPPAGGDGSSIGRIAAVWTLLRSTGYYLYLLIAIVDASDVLSLEPTDKDANPWFEDIHPAHHFHLSFPDALSVATYYLYSQQILHTRSSILISVDVIPLVNT